jgi:hypothetical protein
MYSPNSPSLTYLNVEEGGTEAWTVKDIEKRRQRENNGSSIGLEDTYFCLLA